MARLTDVQGKAATASRPRQVLHALGRIRRRSGRVQSRVDAPVTCSIGTGGVTTRLSGPRTGQLHWFVFVEGVRQGTASSPGRRRKPTIRRGRTAPNTGLVAVRAGPRSPGTPTTHPGALSVRTWGAGWRCSGKPGTPVMVLAWARHRRRSVAPAVVSAGARQGGLVRVSWEEAIGIAAAAHVHTIKQYGPDRCSDSPDPRDVDGVALWGTRFIQLIGG